MALWSIKTLLHFSRSPWNIYFADDGSIDADTRQLLESHFPGCHILVASERAAVMTERLSPFESCSKLRLQSNCVLASKLFDPHVFLRDKRFLLLDSDILFFRYPAELLRQLDATSAGCNCFNAQNDRVNSGLGVIDAASIDFDWIESALRQKSPAQKRAWWIEQDLYEELSNHYGCKLLPLEYAVAGYRSSAPISELVSCHYISIVRHKFFSEGIQTLMQSGFLNAIGNDPSK